MDRGGRATIPNFQERGVLKGVRPADGHGERFNLVRKAPERREELAESIRRDLIGTRGALGDEADLLEHEMEEVIRVEPCDIQVRERTTKIAETGLDVLCWNPHHAAGKDAVVIPPALVIVPSVRERRCALKGLPNASIRTGLPTIRAATSPPFEPPASQTCIPATRCAGS